MDLYHTYLTRAVALLERDLNETMPGTWLCSVDEDGRISVSDGQRTGKAVVERHKVQTGAVLKEWAFNEAAWAVQDIVESFEAAWPRCPLHDYFPVTFGNGRWTCMRTSPGHQLGKIGSLSVRKYVVLRRSGTYPVDYLREFLGSLDLRARR